MAEYIKKDTVIKILGGIVAAVFVSAISWLFFTVFDNSTNIAKLADKSMQDKAQWEAINKLRDFHFIGPKDGRGD